MTNRETQRAIKKQSREHEKLARRNRKNSARNAQWHIEQKNEKGFVEKRMREVVLDGYETITVHVWCAVIDFEEVVCATKEDAEKRLVELRVEKQEKEKRGNAIFAAVEAANEAIEKTHQIQNILEDAGIFESIDSDELTNARSSIWKTRKQLKEML